MKKKPLSKKSREAIDALDESAQCWGWERDQGNGKAVDRAEQGYRADRKALRKHVRKLEQPAGDQEVWILGDKYNLPSEIEKVFDRIDTLKKQGATESLTVLACSLCSSFR